MQSCNTFEFYTPLQTQKDAPYERSPAISGVRSSNRALPFRYKSTKNDGALISPRQPRISSSGQSSTGRLTLLDILSVSSGVTHYTLQARWCARGVPLDSLRGYGKCPQEPLRPACIFPLSSFCSCQSITLLSLIICIKIAAVHYEQPLCKALFRVKRA